MLRQIFDLDVLWLGFALNFKLLDLLAPFFNDLLQLTLLALIGLDCFGLHLLRQLNLCELNQFTTEQTVLATDLAVELAPSRVDHPGCIRNGLGSIFDQSVYIVGRGYGTRPRVKPWASPCTTKAWWFRRSSVRIANGW